MTVSSRPSTAIGLVAVQTPQAFAAGIAARRARRRRDATDDAALVEAIGGTVVVVPGDPRNLKITGPADLRSPPRCSSES